MEAKTLTTSCQASNVKTTFVLAFLLLFLSSIQVSSADTTTKETSSNNIVYKNYLKTACNGTTYPKLCYDSLSSYTSTTKTNDLKLCNMALTVTLKAASNTSSLITSLLKQKGLSKTEVAVIKDCVDEIGDSIDELKQSLKALGSLKTSSPDVKFQIANIKTWVSAAITDENTCTDGFDGTKVSPAVKAKIRHGILNVARLSSNALALINKLSY